MSDEFGAFLLGVLLMAVVESVASKRYGFAALFVGMFIIEAALWWSLR